MPVPEVIDSFISRWENSGAAERANYQMFLSELCDLLEVPRPDPTSPDPENNLHVFDRAITRVNPDGSSVTNYIDLYKARHFVCETKQGCGGDDPSPSSLSTKSGHGRRGSAAFDKALERAYHQGRDYITHLPASHGRPPFLIVCDVGHSIDLYSEFTCTGGRYERFPDESASPVLFDYVNPRRAEWPQADYIVGNPPFIGNKRMREALGDGYTEALRKAWKGSQ